VYQHSVERSTELLRKALPLMSRQAAALHPASYAVWYAYVSDDKSALHQALDAHLAAHGSLDEAATEAMYRRYLAEPQQQPPELPSEKMAEELHRLLDGMQASATAAGDETARYGHSLQQLSAALGPDVPSATPPALDMVREHTLQMQSALTQLQRQLAESQSEINTLRDEVRSARQESLIDALTGLGNRRAFDRHLSTCLASCLATDVAAAALGAATSAAPVCLLMIDIDRFKRVNDTYGHAFGDQVLRAVGQVLKAAAPEGSLAARVGGEEFALLLPAMALEPARALAEKLRVTVAASRIRRKGSNDAAERITVSLGLALYARRSGPDAALADEAPADFVERADRALYAAKQGGRDRVELAA